MQSNAMIACSLIAECRYILCKDNANRVQRKINLFIFKMYAEL